MHPPGSHSEQFSSFVTFSFFFSTSLSPRGAGSFAALKNEKEEKKLSQTLKPTLMVENGGRMPATPNQSSKIAAQRCLEEKE